MHYLENKIPPPLVTVIIGVIMGLIARFSPVIPVESVLRFGIAAAFVAVGLGCLALGFMMFAHSKTTIDPVNLQRASKLITGGIFRFTRNPMYVGFTALLVGWAMALAAPWTLLGPVAFVIFTHCFQIVPEERVMSKKFGHDYLQYKTKVRRWL